MVFFYFRSDPDPCFHETDPRIRSRIKIKRIRNTGTYSRAFFLPCAIAKCIVILSVSTLVDPATPLGSVESGYMPGDSPGTTTHPYYEFKILILISTRNSHSFYVTAQQVGECNINKILNNEFVLPKIYMKGAEWLVHGACVERLGYRFTV